MSPASKPTPPSQREHVDPHELAKLLNLKKRKGVVGYSGVLQRKIKDGREQKSWAIRVYVEKKLPPEACGADGCLPPEIDGVPTDVIEVGKVRALPFPTPAPYSSGNPNPQSGDLDPRPRYRPLVGGISAIADGLTACTLGWFAKDLVDQKTVIICNNHCGAGENKLPVGHPYMQTSPYDSGYGAVERVGTLKRFVEVKYLSFACPVRETLHRLLYRFPRWVARMESPVNQVDLALIDPECELKRELLNIGSVMGKRRGNVGELMHKMGRTTGHTVGGELIDNNYFGTVGYSRGQAAFGPVGLIRGNNFSAGGDSSSAILCSDNSFAGLLFAGSDTVTLYCHFDEIEDQGNVEIIW